MAIRRLIGWLVLATKWVLATVGGFAIALVGIFVIDTFLPYFGQSSHGNQVAAQISAVLKTNQPEFPVAKVADFEWSHVCYAGRGSMPSEDVAKTMGIDVSEIRRRPWFGDRRFWTLVFVLPDKEVEVVRLSTSTAGHRGYGNSASYCLTRDEAVFAVVPDQIFGRRLTLVRREWHSEEELHKLINSNLENTLLSADQVFRSDWKTMCIVPSNRPQFEVTEAVGVLVEWHSVLYPWIDSPAYYSLLLVDEKSEGRAIRIPAKHYIPTTPSAETTITCRARNVAKILIRTGPGDIKALSIPN